MASSRWAVDAATWGYSATSVSRSSDRSPRSSRIFRALSTDSMGYCGAGTSKTTGAPCFCMAETYSIRRPLLLPHDEADLGRWHLDDGLFEHLGDEQLARLVRPRNEALLVGVAGQRGQRRLVPLQPVAPVIPAEHLLCVGHVVGQPGQHVAQRRGLSQP